MGIYLYLGIYSLAGATAAIGAFFALCILLNKKGLFKLSRAAIVAVTNLGILSFSLYLGYSCGIYLYIFVAPLLIYLLFDLTEKWQMAVTFLLYLVTFVICFLHTNPVLGPPPQLDQRAIRLIYSFNFCAVLVLSLGLITYFARNNHRYIHNLRSNHGQLQEEMDLRKQSEDLLRKSLNEREILLAEIHHRVKNNMAIVSSLINLQIDNLPEEKSKEIFRETHNRIYVMSLIHNLLYQNNSFSNIDFAEYTERFCEHLASTYESEKNIAFELQIEKLQLDMKTAIPLALILNELVSNSFKHAFHQQHEGKISVTLLHQGQGNLKFTISDSGIGMEERSLLQGNMGMDIIRSLTEQLDGKMSYKRENGSHFTFLVPLPLVTAN